MDDDNPDKMEDFYELLYEEGSFNNQDKEDILIENHEVIYQLNGSDKGIYPHIGEVELIEGIDEEMEVETVEIFQSDDSKQVRCKVGSILRGRKKLPLKYKS
jgi:hypothetical protein